MTIMRRMILTAPLEGALYPFFCAQQDKDLLSGRVHRFWRFAPVLTGTRVCTSGGENVKVFILTDFCEPVRLSLPRRADCFPNARRGVGVWEITHLTWQQPLQIQSQLRSTFSVQFSCQLSESECARPRDRLEAEAFLQRYHLRSGCGCYS